MFKVMMEKQCGCFKDSGEAAEKSFDSKDAAMTEAMAMAARMNEEFCQKHEFSVTEQGDDLIVAVAMRD